jgi:hypothetical protein
MPKRPTQVFDPAAAMAERLRRLEATASAERADAGSPERWGVAGEALALPAQADVEALRDARGQVTRAHRVDAFERLHDRGALGAELLAAVRRLERDIGERAGLFRAGLDLVKVDAQAKAEGATQRMLAAGARAEAVLAACGPRSARLLRALIEPALLAGRTVDWRETVARETGEANPHAQAAALRAACDNLLLAYRDIDRTGRIRA